MTKNVTPRQLRLWAEVEPARPPRAPRKRRPRPKPEKLTIADPRQLTLECLNGS
jgi:hypothetical protein